MAGPGAREGAFFGGALGIGDLNGDGRGDLAVGAPLEDVSFDQEGTVNVLYGARKHLSLRGDQFLSEEKPGMAGDGAQDGDLFGEGLGAGDFDGDGRDDLAIGEPQNTFYSYPCSGGGALHLLHGAPDRLSLEGNQFLTQDTPGMAGDGSQLCDGFGEVVLGGDPRT